MATWYFKNGEQQFGPCNEQQLKGEVDAGRIAPETMIRQGENGNWFRADQIPGLLTVPVPSTAPPAFCDSPVGNPQEKVKEVIQQIKTDATKIKFQWSRWNNGGKIIFCSACIAILSLFLPWINFMVGINAFSAKGAFLFVFVFAYPVWIVLTNQSLNRVGGYICSGLGVFFGIIFIGMCSVEMGYQNINLASYGPNLFIVCCAVMGVGVHLYSPCLSSIE